MTSRPALPAIGRRPARLAVHPDAEGAVLQVRRAPGPKDIGVIRQLARSAAFTEHLSGGQRFVVDLTALRAPLSAAATAAFVALAHDVAHRTGNRLTLLVDDDRPALVPARLVGLDHLVTLVGATAWSERGPRSRSGSGSEVVQARPDPVGGDALLVA